MQSGDIACSHICALCAACFHHERSKLERLGISIIRLSSYTSSCRSADAAWVSLCNKHALYGPLNFFLFRIALFHLRHIRHRQITPHIIVQFGFDLLRMATSSNGYPLDADADCSPNTFFLEFKYYLSDIHWGSIALFVGLDGVPTGNTSL